MYSYWGLLLKQYRIPFLKFQLKPENQNYVICGIFTGKFQINPNCYYIYLITSKTRGE